MYLLLLGTALSGSSNKTKSFIKINSNRERQILSIKKEIRVIENSWIACSILATILLLADSGKEVTMLLMKHDVENFIVFKSKASCRFQNTITYIILSEPHML